MTMIDAETIKAIVVSALFILAAIVLCLSHRKGLAGIPWAIAISLFIAARILGQ
jgi:hypothetical protein